MPRIDKIDRRTDVVFLLFHHAKKIRGVTKVQKLLFLIEKETEFFDEYKESIAFNFAPYKMGPFSEHVYEELEFLLGLDAIEATSLDEPVRAHTDQDLGQKEFTITPKGEKIASQLSSQLESKYDDEIADIVQSYNNKPLKDLLKYVYQEYPDYAANSEIITDLGLEGKVTTTN